MNKALNPIGHIPIPIYSTYGMNTNPANPPVSPGSGTSAQEAYLWKDRPGFPPAKRIFFTPALNAFLRTMQASPLPLCLAWGAELTLYFNPAFRPFSGSGSSDDPFGKPAAEALADGWERWKPLFAQAMKGQAAHFAGYTDRGGKQHDIALSPFYNEQGEVCGVLLSALESRGAPAGETALEAQRASERQRLFDLFMQAPSPICILRGREGFCELANPLFQKVFGDRPLLHRFMRDAVPELEGQVYFALIEHVFDSGETVYGNEAPVVADWKCDGHLSEAYFNFVFTPYRNPDGEVEGVMIFGFEVTEQKRSGQAIRDSEERFRTIADTAPVMIWMAGTDQQCYFFNREWLGFTGRTLEEEQGRQWMEGIHPDDRERRRETFNAAFADRHPYEVEFRLRRRDGQYRWVSDRGRPRFAPDGTFLGYIGGCIDVHEVKMVRDELEGLVDERTRALREANADLRRSNEELQQFAYVASHDLQEPIRKIRLFADRLATHPGAALDDTARTYLDKITAATGRMTDLIHDLLDYSCLDRDPELFQTADLQEVLQRVLDGLAEPIRRKQATLTSGPLPSVTAIPAQLRQLFHNLISNSLKFSRPGVAPVIRIDARPLPPEEAAALELNPALEYLELIFADNGIGFRQEFAEQIFTIFQRLNGRHEYPGTGIGLAVCRKIAVNHRGGIRAESVEGVGTQVRVVLESGGARLATDIH